jgi:holliday junction DNA helicase RuvA
MSIIAGIEGLLEAKRADTALVRVGGVTFQISVPSHDLMALPNAGSVVRLVTHLVVREDDLQLYGFADERGRTMFESLLGISGVGPKAALAVLSVMSAEELVTSILAGDANAISKAQGVGKRTAERIILELRGKVEDELGGLPLTASSGTGGVTAGSAGDPALAALLGLGFSALEARQALGVEPEDGLSVDDRVRRALQRIGTNNGN